MSFWGQFFKCSTCAEKDQRIIDLKEQVKFLRGYINPTSADATLMSMEAQHILDGSLHNTIDIRSPSEDLQKERERIAREAERMLSGDELIDE